MSDESKLNDLFRRRLSHATMDVRDGFWEEIQRDLPPVAPVGRPLWTPWVRRLTAAAAVALVLGLASVSFWYFSPEEELEDAWAQLPAQEPEVKPENRMPEENILSVPIVSRHAPMEAQVPPSVQAAGMQNNSASIHFSITIRQRMYAQQTDGRHRQTFVPGYNGFRTAAGAYGGKDSPFSEADDASCPGENIMGNRKKWAWQLGVGTALPKAECKMPLTLQATAERRFNKTLALEAGLQYNYLPVKGGDDLHALAIPVKLNVMLASLSRFDLYATVGGTVEKTVNRSFGDDPLRMSALAGVGVRYKLDERFALFAEPTVSHHFTTDSEVPGLRNERPTNLNLLCGVRMTY